MCYLRILMRLCLENAESNTGVARNAERNWKLLFGNVDFAQDTESMAWLLVCVCSGLRFVSQLGSSSPLL